MKSVKSHSKSPHPPFFKGGMRIAEYWASILIDAASITRSSASPDASHAIKSIPSDKGSMCKKTSGWRSRPCSSPPLKKGGRGDLLLRSTDPHIDEPPYLLDHRIRLQQHLSIAETKHLQSHTPQRSASGFISNHRGCFKVLAAVHLDHQTNCRRIKVDDILTQRFLPIELNTMQLLPPQPTPHALLGVSHVPAQVSRARFELSVISKHHAIKAASRIRRCRVSPRATVG